MHIIGHLLATAFRTFWHIVVTALICAVIFGSAVLIVSYTSTHQWPPNRLTEILAGALAVVAAYAGGLTVLAHAAVKALMDATKLAEHEALAPIKAAAEALEGRHS